jgi:hypothetical protein
MKPTGSDTTTSLGELVTSIGTKPGGAGSPSPPTSNVVIEGPSGPPPELPEPSKSAQKIVDAETRHWLALMRYQTHLPPEVDRTEARRVIAPALGRARRALEPASSDQIVKAISMMADMIQCSLPEPDGITLYVAVLQDLGHEAIRRACMDICKTHPYPRLPLPSEILKAGALPQAELMFWHQQLERAMLLLSKEEP